MSSEFISYGLQRNESERFAKKPMKECSRTLLANKSFCGGGVLIMREGTLTEIEINELGRRYAMGEAVAFDEQNKCVRQDGTVGTLTTDGSSHCGGGQEIKIETQNYKIRKPTPRECFRLMGVKDEDFDKIAKNQSDSSLYHLAGDSIVVDVLCAIFKQMIL